MERRAVDRVGRGRRELDGGSRAVLYSENVLTTDQKGAIAESAIVHAATKLGIDVYKPLAGGGRYDLIFDVRDKLLRVQCKWATLSEEVVVVRCYSCRRGAERMIVRAYTSEEVDAIVAYCAELDRCYFLPPARFAGRWQVHLRTAPYRNNQRVGVHMASDYLLEARLHASGP